MTTNVPLRNPAGITTSFRQQLLLLVQSGRWGLMLLAGVLVLVGVERSGADWSRSGLFLAAVCVLALGSAWPLVVWQGEAPLRRYHWSLPVPRAAHDLARVAAGAILLAVASAALAATIVLRLEPGATLGAGVWGTFFAGPLILYFLATPFVLWSDSPVVKWGGAVFAGWAIAVLLDIPGLRAPLLAVFEASWGLEAALFGGYLREVDGLGAAPGVSAGWLALGIAATLFAAVWRPSELARRFRT